MVFNQLRYIPVPTGNSNCNLFGRNAQPVYPCTYRELLKDHDLIELFNGISLYLQGTHLHFWIVGIHFRYIPVPTGNSAGTLHTAWAWTVYPCTYRELAVLIKQQRNSIRYIPVPTGNSNNCNTSKIISAVYPCTYRELTPSSFSFVLLPGISLYLQGTQDLLNLI